MNSRHLLLGGIATAAIASSPAGAQSAPTHAGWQADQATDIVVTARRIEERAQDVPISITVLNQQQLANNNVVSAADLAATTPSLSVNSNYGSQNSSFSIRGFIQDNGTAPSVGVYFADVVAPRAASNGLPAGDGAGSGNLFDLQNVQVLNGPQGTLFGRNTTGGAVLLVPKRPTDKLEGYVEASLGDYDMRRIQAVLNIPINDTLRIRLGVDRMKRSGYLKSNSGIGPSDFNDANYTAARLSVVEDLTPNLENYIIASYSRSDTHGDFEKLIAADPAFGIGFLSAAQLAPGSPNYQGSGFYDAAQSLPDPRSLLTQWQVIDTVTWRPSDTLTVKNIASYSELKDYYNNPIFGTNFQSPAVGALGFPSYPLDFAWSFVLPGHNTAHESTFTDEFRLAGSSPGNRLSWQSGAYLELVRPLEEVGSQSPVLESCATPSAIANFQCYDVLGFLGALQGGTTPAGAINLTEGKTSFNDFGIYAQGTYKVSNHLKITAGIRYTGDSETNTSTQTTTFTAFPPNALGITGPSALPYVPFTQCTYSDAADQNPSDPAGCQRAFHHTWHAPTWTVDLEYSPIDQAMLYAKYSRGYRTGGIAPNVSPPFNYFAAERVDVYEAGAKTSFRGPVSGIFNVTGFYNDFSNQQLSLGFNPNPCYTKDANGACVAAPATPTAAPVNAGKSRLMGIETSASLNLFSGFNVNLGYTYLNTRILSIPSFSTPPGSLFVVSGAYQVGDPLPLAPRNKFSITGTYRLPLATSIGQVSIGATFTHTDSMFTNPQDRSYVGGTYSSPATVPAIRSLSTLQATNLLNLNANWDHIGGGPVDLSAFATNVTGEHYYAYIPGLASAIGGEVASIGAPRMYGARVRVSF